MTQAQQHPPQRVLLVGCGQLGTELGQRLIANGTQVYGLRRNPSQLPSGFEPLAVDLLQPVTRSIPSVDAMVITLTPSITDPAGANGYLVALQHLAQALPQVPSRVLFVSSTRVFEGTNTEQAITELTRSRRCLSAVRPWLPGSSWQPSYSTHTSCAPRGSTGQDAKCYFEKSCTTNRSNMLAAPTGFIKPTSREHCSSS